MGGDETGGKDESIEGDGRGGARVGGGNVDGIRGDVGYAVGYEIYIVGNERFEIAGARRETTTAYCEGWDESLSDVRFAGETRAHEATDCFNSVGLHSGVEDSTSIDKVSGYFDGFTEFVEGFRVGFECFDLFGCDYFGFVVSIGNADVV